MNNMFLLQACPSLIYRIGLDSLPCWKDSAALQLFCSWVGPLHSSICSINCLNAQLVSASRPASSLRCSGDASRETAGPPAPLAQPLMVIVAGRSDPVRVRKRCGTKEDGGRRWTGKPQRATVKYNFGYNKNKNFNHFLFVKILAGENEGKSLCGQCRWANVTVTEYLSDIKQEMTQGKKQWFMGLKKK